MRLFSDQAITLLARAGWFEGRTIDVSRVVELLHGAGHPVPEVVSEFLREFGMLAFANPDAVPPAAEDWHFDVPRALKLGASRARVTYYNHLLDVELCPIGLAFTEHMILMMNSEGRVYAGYDQVFLSVGGSGVDAINALSDGRTLSPVDLPHADAA